MLTSPVPRYRPLYRHRDAAYFCFLVLGLCTNSSTLRASHRSDVTDIAFMVLREPCLRSCLSANSSTTPPTQVPRFLTCVGFAVCYVSFFCLCFRAHSLFFFLFASLRPESCLVLRFFVAQLHCCHLANGFIPDPELPLFSSKMGFHYY